MIPRGLNFRINNEFIDLPDDLEAQMNRFSPLFQNDGLIRDDFTFPINLPYTDHNARLFGNPANVDNLTPFKPRFAAEMWMDGMPKLSGELRIKSCTEDEEISVYFVYGLSEIAEDVRTKSLRDIMNETVVIHNTNFDKRIKFYYNPTFQGFISLIINGTRYDEATVQDLVDAINADVNQTASAVYSEETPGSRTFRFVTVIPGSANELEPFDVAFAPTEYNEDDEVVSQSKWTVQEVDWIDPYNTLYTEFTDNYRGVDPDRKLRFLTYANLQDFNTVEGIKRYPFVNLYDAEGLLKNGFLTTQTSRGEFFVPESINQTSLAPQVTLAYILERIEEHYNIKINYPLVTDYPLATPVVFSPNTLDVPLTYFNRKKTIFFKREFNINEFVPDITVNDFLKSIQGIGFQIVWDSKSRTVTFKSRNPIAASPDYISVAGRHGKIMNVVNQQKTGITLEHVLDPKDIYIPQTIVDEDQFYVVGEGERTIPSRISVPNSGFVTPFPNASNTYLGIIIHQPQEENFKQVKLATQSGTHDYLEVYFLDPDGFSLRWKEQVGFDEIGLFDLFWKDWIQMEDNTPAAKTTLFVPDKWVWNPPWEHKILIDRNKYFIRSFSVVLAEGDIVELECEIVKVPNSRRGGSLGSGVEIKGF